MTWFIIQSLLTLVLAFALGIVVGWLVWARRRPADAGVAAELAAAKEQMAACTCDAGAASDADPGADADLEADDTDLDADDDLDAPSEADDLDVVMAEEVDVDELVATYEALEEIDADLDSPTVAADGTVQDDDTDDVAALAVAVGALNKTVEAGPDKAAPDSSVPDRIERIEGIGPKIGQALRAAGLDTYAAIADAPQEALREAIKAGGVKFAPSVESWSSQARLLADGDEDGFQALTGRLVAGRTKD